MSTTAPTHPLPSLERTCVPVCSDVCKDSKVCRESGLFSGSVPDHGPSPIALQRGPLAGRAVGSKDQIIVYCMTVLDVTVQAYMW